MARRDEEKREELVQDFLQGGPQSEEWRLWREALEKRLAELKKQRKSLSGEGGAKELDEMIEETEKQINALATEEIISEFVESEIDLALNTAEDDEDFGTFEDLGGNGRH